MGSGDKTDNPGYELGQAALAQTVERAGQICAQERQRRELANRAEIVRLYGQVLGLLEERREIQRFLDGAYPGDLASLRKRRWSYLSVAFILALAGVFFAHLSLQPFGLGSETWMVCVAIGLVCPFLTHFTLAKLECLSLVKVLCVLGLVTGLTGLILMAILRGDIVLLYLNSALSFGSQQASGQNSQVFVQEFYRSAIWKLRLFFAVLAPAMELASGLALYESLAVHLTGLEAVERARQRRATLNEEWAGLTGQITFLQNEPAIFEAGFWRDYHTGLLDGIRRNGLTRFLLVPFLFFLFRPAPAGASQAPTVVVALDVSRSEVPIGYDGKTESDKNLAAATRLVSALPAGSRLVVAGITDQSFSRPWVLLDRRLPASKGKLQFLDEVEVGRQRIVAELQALDESVRPRFNRTDVLGFFLFAADILARCQGPKVIVLFSDMRHSAGIDIEAPVRLNVTEALRQVARQRLLPDLTGVEVYVCGAHAVGKDALYWHSLREFWAEYFRETGAHLKAYSMTRELPDFSGPALSKTKDETSSHD